MPGIWNGGTKNLTASGETATAATPIRINNIHVIGDGVAAPVITLKNNGTGGTIYVQQTGPATATGTTFEYGIHGHLFPLGAYVTFDGHTAAVTVNYSL